MVACHTVAAVSALVSLLVAMALCIAGTTTTSWLTGKTSVPMSIPVMSFLKAEIQSDMDIEFGLYKACYENQIKILGPKLILMFVQNAPKSKRICMGKDDLSELTDKQRANIKRDMKPFKNTLICMIVGLIVLGVAFGVAVVKSPCVSISTKKSMLIVSICLMFISAGMILSGVLIAHKQIHGEAKFISTLIEVGTTSSMMDFMPKQKEESGPPPQPKSKTEPPKSVTATSTTIDASNRASNVADNGLKRRRRSLPNMEHIQEIVVKMMTPRVAEALHKDFSFKLVISGLCFVVMAIGCTLLELYFASKAKDDEYYRDLIKKDDYEVPEKSHPEKA